MRTIKTVGYINLDKVAKHAIRLLLLKKTNTMKINNINKTIIRQK